MIQFNEISQADFLKNYWQKKPFLFKGALANVKPPLSAEELAGLSLEDGVESRIIVQEGEKNYRLMNGPFDESTYETLPKKDWTLLVQGVDRLVPGVADMLADFSFIPHWRIDDIMISYAVEGGNVGPHFDHYDVFLCQMQGKRQWQLTSQDCLETNYIKDVSVRLMDTYTVEDTYVVEPGDILYVPPKWGHHGVSLTDDCMTYSVGYRAYKGLELWDSFGEYLDEHEHFKTLYQDPDWSASQPGEISLDAVKQAKTLLMGAMENEALFTRWFCQFATTLDSSANELLPIPYADDELPGQHEVIEAAMASEGIIRDDVCRLSYCQTDEGIILSFNGQILHNQDASDEFVMALCNQRMIDGPRLHAFLADESNHILFTSLWAQQIVSFIA